MAATEEDLIRAQEDDETDETEADLDEEEEDEVDNADQPPDAQPEPEHDAGAQSEAEIRAKIEKIGRSAQTFRRRIEEVLGDDAVALVPCELCEPEIPGFHWPVEYARARDEIHARLLQVLKTPAEIQYRTDPSTRECEVCGGEGKLERPTKVAAQKLTTCHVCRGFGFQPPPDLQGSAGPAAAGMEQGTVPPDDFGPTADVDIWGEPRILDDGRLNPLFGLMPQYKAQMLAQMGG